MATIEGNMLESKGILVHGCNCQGVMGGGIAWSIRQKWQHVYDAYRKLYEEEGLNLGDVQQVHAEEGVIVVNAMTQEDFGGDGKRYVDYDAIRTCFKEVRKMAEELKLPVHYPLIGCGLAGGDWGIVSSIINEELEGMEHHLYVYNPNQQANS